MSALVDCRGQPLAIGDTVMIRARIALPHPQWNFSNVELLPWVPSPSPGQVIYAISASALCRANNLSDLMFM